ncbi:uncharacterized protein [Primulina eburnea]|uniref:uncharacterized protein isoform X1 n=1 Tax=Primulina eburnea TaxID=1245227 RepID=UPI003C6C537E
MENCSMCGEFNIKDCGKSYHTGRKTDDSPCSFNCVRNCFQQSTYSTMSQNFAPSFVYHRRKQNHSSSCICTIQPTSAAKCSDVCRSSISSEAAPAGLPQEKVSEIGTESTWLPVACPVECNQDTTVDYDECPTEERASSEEALISDVDIALNVICGNNCSSSKSNLDVGSASLKIDVEDTGECSSSGALVTEKVPDISERDICISILRSQGLLEKFRTRPNQADAENTGNSGSRCCSKTCKVCGHLETSKNLLICDNCEDAFHITCCEPHAARIPAGEWLCNSCLKKKHKILKEKSSGNLNTSMEIGKYGISASVGELGSLEFMFRDTEPHMSCVRIGDDFQASVPDWRGPIDGECDLNGVQIEIHPLEDDCSWEWKSTKPLKLSSIGNWIQCREMIEGVRKGVDGTMCGKWRRAPLFEVQTDKWECFCCIHWDPAHADCAVPQELDTEEVMKQLKYVELLRPRLAAKRRKLNCLKSNGSQDLSRS